MHQPQNYRTSKTLVTMMHLRVARLCKGLLCVVALYSVCHVIVVVVEEFGRVVAVFEMVLGTNIPSAVRTLLWLILAMEFPVEIVVV